ncbi:MAG: transcriptional regulator [Candidatus Woesearchaeota archaeon]
MTVRKGMIELLQEKRMTLRELAIQFKSTMKDTGKDLVHIAKSIQPEMELKMEIPVCRHCGYIYKERTRITRPSRCPKCKMEDITEPRFWIEIKNQSISSHHEKK